jgi:RimJ/RimL family protein N-acetyltransferase
MTQVELVGERLIIRNARPDDAEASFRWFANPEVTRYLPLAGKGFLPMEHVVAFLEKASGSDRPELAVTIAFISGRPIGCGGYRNFVEGHSAELSLILGEPEVWGKGYGREALDLMLGYAFQNLGLHEVWLMVRVDNGKGVRLFDRSGFRICEGEGIEVQIEDRTVRKQKMKLEKSRWTPGRSAEWNIGSRGNGCSTPSTP